MLDHTMNPGLVVKILGLIISLSLATGCPSTAGVLELRVAIALSAEEETIALDEQRRRASCQECVPLTWEFADGLSAVFLVEKSPTARLPIAEIEKTHIMTSRTSEADAKVFLLAAKPTPRGMEAIVDAKRHLRPVFVFFEGEPIGLGGAVPISSFYSLGEFASWEAARSTADRLGLKIEPLRSGQEEATDREE